MSRVLVMLRSGMAFLRFSPDLRSSSCMVMMVQEWIAQLNRLVSLADAILLSFVRVDWRRSENFNLKSIHANTPMLIGK